MLLQVLQRCSAADQIDFAAGRCVKAPALGEENGDLAGRYGVWTMHKQSIAAPKSS